MIKRSPVRQYQAQPPPQPASTDGPRTALVLAWAISALPLAGCTAPSGLFTPHPMLDLALGLALALALGGLALVLRRSQVRLRSLEQLCASTEADQTRGRLAGVLRAASRISIISTDIRGVIQVFNSGAERMLGYSAHELRGKATAATLHLPAEVEAYGRELSERLGQHVAGFDVFVVLAREGGPQGFDAREWTYVRKDGGLVPVHLTVTGIYSDSGELEGFLGVALDLSASKALEADLRQAQVSVDNAGDMIFWARADDARLVYANQAACDLLGYSRNDFLNMHVMDMNPNRTLESWREHSDLARRLGRTTQETTFRRKDGSIVPVESTSSLVEHGGVEYTLGIIRDISQRKAAEETLSRETRLNRSLAEAARTLIGPAPDMAAVAELLLNRACELTGSRLGYVAFVDQNTGEIAPRALASLTSGGQCALGSLPITFPIEKDGSYRGLWGHSLNTRQGFYENNPAAHPSAVGLPAGHVPIERLLSVPAVSKGHLVGQIALANPRRDYTQADLDTVAALADIFALGVEQILAQQGILRAKEEAESSSRAKSDFLANMTHEVRTPLNGVLGMLQVLQSTDLTQEQQDYAAVALESAERLNLLLGNVIEYARLENAGPETECLPFPPTDLLNSLRAEFEQQAMSRGLAFTVRHATNLPELVHSDPQALRQALAKLLDNALKFTPEGAVLLEAGPDPHNTARLQFRVEDTGIGIPPDKRQQVFEAFVQADASVTRTYAARAWAWPSRAGWPNALARPWKPRNDPAAAPSCF